MVIRPTRFNIYLLCLAVLASAVGCRSPEKRREKQPAMLRVHVEVNPDSAGLSEAVPIYRANPMMVTVDKNSILTQVNIASARVITDRLGGFALQVQFDQHGALVLEQVTASHSGRRLAVFAEWGEKLVEKRWLAAPIVRRIGNGTLTFTPDASREECNDITRGWNNVAIKSGNQPKPKKSKESEKAESK